MAETGGAPTGRLVLERPSARPTARLRAAAGAHRADLLAGAGATLGALVAAVVALRAWRGDLGTAWDYEGDALFFEMLVKGVLEFGWYLANPNLGAPLGQELYDVPAIPLENANVALLWFLGLFSSDPAVVVNVFYLLGYPIAALSAFIVLRALRVSAAAAAVCAVLFALAPYHFVRGEFHLFLGAYFTVPIGVYLVLQVLRGEALFRRRADGSARGPLAWASGRTLGTLALCVLVGSTGGYYIAFTLAALVAATVVVAASRPPRRAVLTGVVVSGAVAVAMVVALSPSIVYALEHGRNTETARDATMADDLGLRPGYLLVPVRDHRLELLDDLREHVYDPATNEAHSMALGIVGVFGLAALVLGGLARLLRGRGTEDEADGRFGAASAAVFILVLLATAGGVAAIIRFFVGAELRAWNRVSIYIAFLALLAVALILDRLRERGPLASRQPAAWGALLAAVLVVGLLDQTNASFIPDYDRAAAQQRSDEAFVRRIERTLPAGAAVAQIPYVPFFEGRNGEEDYALLRPYLHSRHLRWSFGSVKGRPRDWLAELATLPPAYVLPSVAAAGFDGVVVHRQLFEDRGAAVEQQVCDLAGMRPTTSPDGTLAFFDLRPYRDRLDATFGGARVGALGEATVHPVRVAYDHGFGGVEQDGASRWSWATARRAVLEVENPARAPRAVRLTGLVTYGHPAVVTVRYPDGAVERVAIRDAGLGEGFAHDVLLAPGRSEVVFETKSASTPAAPGDNRTLYFRLVNPVALDGSLPGFVSSLARGPGCPLA